MLRLEVLNGGLGGRAFQFDRVEVRLGRHPSCQVVFDAQRDDSVGRWHAHLRPEGNGWSVENLHENGTFLNGQPVTDKALVRSGDLIRLSRDGPEIRLTFIEQPVRPAAMAPHASANPMAASPVLLGAPVPSSMSAMHHGRSRLPANAWLGVSAVGIVAVSLLAILVSAKLAGKNKSSPTPRAPSDNSKSPESRTSQAVPATQRPESQQKESDTELRKPDQRQPDAWQIVERRNRRAVYAVAAEDPSGLMWPLGTATAIRTDFLVTTASLATQMETLRREGWKTWALGSEANSGKEIATIQLHIGFVKSSEKPEQQSFFDLALLSTKGTASEVSELASDEELNALDARQPFGCLIISLPIGDKTDPTEPLDRFDGLVASITPGKIQGLLQLSRDPGAPRMLLLPASMPNHIWGSPVYNANGKLVAVCTEAAQKTDTGQVRLNYAPLVTGVVEWNRGRGQEYWVPVPLER
jgi:hypothetical protein